MNARPLLVSFGLVAVTAFGSLLAGLAVAGIVGEARPIVASAVAAIVIAALFARRPMEGLLAFLIAVLFVDTVEFWARADIRYLDEAALPLLGAAALAFHRGRLAIPRPGLREAALLVFILAALASTVVNAVPLRVWGPGLVLLAKGFAFFYLVASIRLRLDELRVGMVITFAVGIAITAIGLAEFLAPELVRGLLSLPASDQQRGDVTIVTSVFLHPALFGWITAFTSLFLYARFAVDRAPWALVGALVMNLGTLLSGRRTPLIGVVLALAVGAARQIRASREAVRTWGAVAAALLLVGIVTLPFLSSLVRDTLADYVAPPEQIEEIFSESPDRTVLRTMQPRIGLYLGSLAIGRDDFPLGEGIGRFGSHMSREVYSPVYAEYGMDGMYGIAEMWPIAVTDAFWPMVLGETGALGLVALLAFFAILGRDLWRAAGREGPIALRVLFLGALLVLVETLVRSLTSSVFVAPPIAYWVFATLGVALSAAGADFRVPDPEAVAGSGAVGPG